MNKEALEKVILSGNLEEINKYILDYNIVDTAECVSELDIVEIVYLFKNLEKVYLGELFSYLSLTIQNRIKDLLTSEELSLVLDQVYTDDVVEYLNQLPWSQIKVILSYTNNERRKLLYDMLGYPDESAGSIMSTDYVELGQYITVKDATQVIKEHEGIAEIMDIYYITNLDGILEGVVSVRDILFAPDLEMIENVMSTDIVYVNAYDKQEDVAKTIAKYDLSFIPVVDNSNKLVGLISADDIIDVVEEEATEDIHKMGGINWIRGSYLETPSKLIAEKRLGWLLVLTVAYVISSFIITKQSNLLELVPSLIIFIPLLMDTAGDAGSQALAMVVRGIAVDTIDKSFYKTVFFKELGVALIAGAFLAVGNFFRIMYFSANTGEFYLALVVSLTVYLVVIISKIVGGILPLVALSFNQDPAVMASPLITTISDSLSLIVYFAIATSFLGGLI